MRGWRAGFWALLGLLCVPTGSAWSEGRDYDPLAAVEAPDPPESRDTEREIKRLLSPERKIFEKAREIELRAAENHANLKRLETALEKRQAIVARARRATSEAELGLNKARSMMHRRLRGLIQTKRIKPYALLFGSDSFSTFLRKQRNIEALLDKDRSRIAGFCAQVTKLRELRADLDKKERWLGNRIEGMGNLRKEILQDNELKKRLLHVVEMKNNYYQELRKEIKASDRELLKLVGQKEGDFGALWFEERKGTHLWPIVNAEIAHDGQFGRRRHPKFGTTTVHRGISMVPKNWNGRDPVRVRSVYKGYVVFTGWVAHLGWTVLVDHTSDYMSVYGHLGPELAVKVGERLERGQKIGHMSDSESLWGKRLYFEIRRDGRPVDPRPFLRR